jgi:hypothetical protein
MTKLIFSALAAATLFAAAGSASAQSIYLGVGPGYNDYGPRPYYRERYVPQPRYERRYVRAPRYNTRVACPRGFTVQDGVCKPYRGY